MQGIICGTVAVLLVALMVSACEERVMPAAVQQPTLPGPPHEVWGPRCQLCVEGEKTEGPHERCESSKVDACKQAGWEECRPCLLALDLALRSAREKRSDFETPTECTREKVHVCKLVSPDMLNWNVSAVQRYKQERRAEPAGPDAGADAGRTWAEIAERASVADKDEENADRTEAARRGHAFTMCECLNRAGLLSGNMTYKGTPITPDEAVRLGRCGLSFDPQWCERSYPISCPKMRSCGGFAGPEAPIHCPQGWRPTWNKNQCAQLCDQSAPKCPVMYDCVRDHAIDAPGHGICIPRGHD